jgi:uncharacterized protein with PQ loop repeat
METFIYIVSILYSIGGTISLMAYIPTIRDLWQGKPSANISSYMVWSMSSFFSVLYGYFVLQDLLFNVMTTINFVVCLLVLALVIRLRLKSK